MSDSDEETIYTPPEIIKKAQAATDNLLPTKSKIIYEKAHKKFMEWRLENQIQSFSENVLLAYFQELSKIFKPSSLWAHYSMLKTVLNLNHNINIARYPKLITLLKRKSDGFKSKKSKCLTAEEIKKFLHNAPDSEYLLIKVILIIGISGACRKQELKNLRMEEVKDTGEHLIILISDSKTKTQRSFVVPETFYGTCKKYINLRPADTKLPFFINYRNNKCIKQVVGINTIGAVPKKIAQFLKLSNPELYTGHSFRRSSATILVDAGGDLLSLKRLGGWKSSTVAKGYINESMKNKKNNALCKYNVLYIFDTLPVWR